MIILSVQATVNRDTHLNSEDGNLHLGSDEFLKYFIAKKFSYCSTFIHQFSRIQILLWNIKNRIPLNKYSGSNIISDNLGNGPKYVRNYSTNFLMTTYFNLEDSLETWSEQNKLSKGWAQRVFGPIFLVARRLTS